MGTRWSTLKKNQITKFNLRFEMQGQKMRQQCRLLSQ